MIRRIFTVAAGLLVLSGVSAPTLEVPLAWQESGFSLSVRHDSSRQEIVFKKEPAYSGDRVLRGALPVGASKSDQMAYAVDWKRKTLFLDRNRNLDLTDDLPTIADDLCKHNLNFNHVSLGPADSSAPRYVVNLVFFRYPSVVQMEVQSGWSGTFVRGTQTWQVIFVDDLDGAWGARDLLALGSLAGRPGEGPDAWGLPPMQKLFFDSAQHEVSLAPGPEGKWVFGLQETSAAVGTLTIEGEKIRRLVLLGGGEDRGQVVILEQPGTAPLPIPAGRYAVQRVTLASGADLFQSERRRVLVVEGGRSAKLAIGGPLQNAATANRRGGRLVLDYALRGRGGEEYKVPPDRQRGGKDLPRVEIFRGARRVASGRFEYG